MSRVAVIGAGVIGLSIAHDLAAAGHRVTAIADVPAVDSVSGVAAAIWFPYRSERSPAADRLLSRSLARFRDLLTSPDAGVDQRSGVIIERGADPDVSWAQFANDASEVPVEELPPGARAGIRGTLPVITMPVYLRWLREQVQALGVVFDSRKVTDLAELTETTDIAVIATGIRGGELLGDDDSVYPIRGQVVRLANPGLTDWTIDDNYPDGMVYIIPRRDDIIVGGTAIVGDWGTEIRPETEEAILERALRLRPELSGLTIVGRAAGLRPARETIRLENVGGHQIPVVAAYGHGGAGVTLAWGTAERVVELVGELT